MAETKTCPHCGHVLLLGYKNRGGTISAPPAGEAENVLCCENCWYEETYSPPKAEESGSVVTQ